MGRNFWQCVAADFMDLRQTAGRHLPQAGDTWVIYQLELFALKDYKTAACFFKKGETAVILGREQETSSMTW